jgi:hypothetical protein
MGGSVVLCEMKIKATLLIEKMNRTLSLAYRHRQSLILCQNDIKRYRYRSLQNIHLDTHSLIWFRTGPVYKRTLYLA